MPEPRPVAVWPARGQLVHLFLPDYQPGAKRRSRRVDTTLCNQPANELVPPPVGPLETGRRQVPIEDAREWVDRPAPDVPNWQPFRWCAVCIGRAAQHYNLMDLVIERVLETTEPC